MLLWLGPQAILLSLFTGIVCAARDVVLDASSSQITYTPAPEVGWLNRTLAGCEDQGTYMCSYTDSSELSVNFNGIAFSVVFMKFQNGARALIEVDGVARATVDTYSATLQCTNEIFKMPNLTDGPHRVRIADATRMIGTRGLVFKSITYTENTLEDPTASLSSASVASVSRTASAPSTTGTGYSSDEETKPNYALIAGASAGGVVAILLLVGIVWFVKRRKRRQHRASTASPPNVRQSANEMLIGPWVPDRTVAQPAYSHQRIASQNTNQTHSTHGSISNYQVEAQSPQMRPASFNPYHSPPSQPPAPLPPQNVSPIEHSLRNAPSRVSLPAQSRIGAPSTVASSPPPNDPDLTKRDSNDQLPPYVP